MHLTLAVGSFSSWAESSRDDWSHLLAGWVEPLRPAALSRGKVNAQLSVVPYEVTDIELSLHTIDVIAARLNAVRRADRLVGECNGVPVEVALVDSGAERLARAGNAILARHERITEKSIDKQIFGDLGEPDLVVACGPATAGVPSLIWELAYSEIVYLDIPWRQIGAAELDRAIRDFHNRNRRFGGV